MLYLPLKLDLYSLGKQELLYCLCCVQNLLYEIDKNILHATFKHPT